jgi:hypothetical protein
VSTSTAASFDRSAAASAERMNTTRNARRTGPRVDGSIRAASRSRIPRARAAAVIAMTAVIVTSGRHSVRATSSRPARSTSPPITAATTAITAATAGAARWGQPTAIPTRERERYERDRGGHRVDGTPAASRARAAAVMTSR